MTLFLFSVLLFLGLALPPYSGGVLLRPLPLPRDPFLSSPATDGSGELSSLRVSRFSAEACNFSSANAHEWVQAHDTFHGGFIQPTNVFIVKWMRTGDTVSVWSRSWYDATISGFCSDSSIA